MSTNIPGIIYDTTVQYVIQQFVYSTGESFKNNKFYRLLPENLKTKLTMHVLDKHYKQFRFFFTDKIMQNQADKVFVRKVLTSLYSRVVFPAQHVIEAG